MAKTSKTRVKEHMREHGFSGSVRTCTIDKTTGGNIITIEVDTSEFNLRWLNTLAAIFNTDKLELSCNCDCDCGCGGSTTIDIYDATLP